MKYKQINRNGLTKAQWELKKHLLYFHNTLASQSELQAVIGLVINTLNNGGINKAGPGIPTLLEDFIYMAHNERLINTRTFNALYLLSRRNGIKFVHEISDMQFLKTRNLGKVSLAEFKKAKMKLIHKKKNDEK